ACAEAPDAGTTTAQTSASTSATSAASTTGSSGAAGFKACMVSDSGGFDDKSFNQTSHDGLVKAKSELGIETAEIESADTKDFATNIKAMVDADCNIVVTVGFLLSDATVAAAKANPDVK